MRLVFLGALICVAAAACSPVDKLKVSYARYSGCSKEKVDVISMWATKAHSDRYRVSGCGNGVMYYCRESRCVSPEITVAQRHAKQFGCSTKSVAVEYLDGGAWKATGCDHNLTYQCFEDDEYVMRCHAETADEDRKQVRRETSQ